jgi:hypothetical protein
MSRPKRKRSGRQAKQPSNQAKQPSSQAKRPNNQAERPSDSKRWSTRVTLAAPAIVVVLGASVTTIFQLAHLGLIWLVAGSALLALCLSFLAAVWSDQERRRLQNLFISFATLVALLIGSYAYHEFFDPSALASRAPKIPEATIIAPASKIVEPGQNVLITGTADNIPASSILWLVTDDDDSYNARAQLSITPQGTWKAYIGLADKHEQAGTEHDVLIVLALDAQTDDALSEQYWDLGGLEELSPDEIIPHTLCRRIYLTG